MTQDFDDNESAPKSGSGDFARMLEDSFKSPKRRLSVGDKIRAEILVLGKEDVFLSTGTPHDGVAQRRDFLDEQGNLTHKVGDVVDAFVTQVRGNEIRLSTKPTAKNLADDLEDAFDMMLPLEGRVAEVCNGGFRVSIKGKLAFCPISQMDLARIDKPEDYVGKRFEFKITRFEESGRNIVVSRRALLEEQRELNVGTFASEHKVGDIVSGKIMRLEKFGAFVELAPGIDGLVHISELAWTRIADPAEVVQPGQEVNAKILKIETQEGRLRISLSLKQAGEGAPDPWSEVSAKYPVGTIVKGKVERMQPYGLFVNLGPGVTGLLPKSKAQEAPEFAYDKVKVGDVIPVQVAEIRSSERRISLAVPGDPNRDDWKGYASPGVSTSGSGGSLGSLGSAFGDKLKAALVKAPEAEKKPKK